MKDQNLQLIDGMKTARLVMLHKHNESHSFKMGASRTLVRSFLAALAPKPSDPPCKFSADLDVVHRVIDSVLAAQQESILTKEETDALVEFVASRFVERRFDSVMQKVVKPEPAGWFVFAGNFTRGVEYGRGEAPYAGSCRRLDFIESA